MKTVIEMADEVFDRMLPDGHCREPYWSATDDELQAFAELVRADERNSWPAEMEAMERQVNILTDALAQASKDAARYQVLRTWDLSGYDYGLYSPEEVDKAIDDCIKEQP